MKGKERTKTGRPTVMQALRAVLTEDFPDSFDAYYITIQVLSTGEVAYRLHERDSKEYLGGVVTVD